MAAAEQSARLLIMISGTADPEAVEKKTDYEICVRNTILPRIRRREIDICAAPVIGSATERSDRVAATNPERRRIV